jgi:hypothetical protein
MPNASNQNSQQIKMNKQKLAARYTGAANQPQGASHSTQQLASGSGHLQFTSNPNQDRHSVQSQQ